MVANVTYLLKLYIYNYCHGEIVIKKTQGYQPKLSKHKVWGKSNRIYETYKNTVMPHGRHIYAKAYSMAKATMCANSQYDHELPHWKCVLRRCAQCTSINIPDQETYDNHPNPIPSISFNIYII